MRKDSFKSRGKIGFYVLLPVFFLLVPTSWLEARGSFCLIRNVFGVCCPGCGMTRAISCVLHGHFRRAFDYNRLVVIVFPLLCYVWVKTVRKEIGSLKA